MEKISLKIIFGVWIVVIIIAYLIGGAGLAGGIFIAGVLSIVIWYFTLSSSWEGNIEDIKTERVYTSSGNDSSIHDYKNVIYAYVRKPDGKIKKIRPMPEWKKGDKIRKEKGKMIPEKV